MARPNSRRQHNHRARYADDFVVGFQHKWDAERFLHDLKERMAAFSLELHPDKTRLIEFGRFAETNRRARGERRPETFDFLGFTHYCRTTRNGKFGLGRKPVGKRVDRTLRRIGAELRRRMHHNQYEVAKWLGKILNGWLYYYAVPTSSPSLLLRRPDQLPVPQAVCISPPANVAARLATPVTDGPHHKLGKMAEVLWPPLTILHPWPEKRFAVTHPR